MASNTQRLEDAAKLLESGRVVDALNLLTDRIKESPRDTESVYLAGVCYARSRDYVTAEKFFARAVKLNKDMFQAYSDLGLAQFRQGKCHQAIKSFKKSLLKNPDFAPAHSYLALTYLQTQQPGRALRHAKKSVVIDGKNPTFLNNQGLCYRHLGDTEKAIEIFERTANAYPNFYGAFHSLYETYRLLDDNYNAEKTLLRAKTNFTNQAIAYLSLGKFYEQTDRTSEALTLYAEGISECSDKKDLLIALGQAYRTRGEIDNGLKKINESLQIDRHYQPAIAERCSFHILQGEYQDAQALLDSFTALQPNEVLTPGLAMAYANTCKLTGQYNKSISLSQATLQHPGITTEMRSMIHFSMGDSYDTLKKYDRAFAMYREANDIIAQKSDIDRYRELLSKIATTVNTDALAKANSSTVTSKKPIFIVGMPRSGTSLVEQILSSHAEIYGAGEITELWAISQDISDSKQLANYPQKLALLNKERLNHYAARYLAFIERLDPHACRITDKLPHNFLHIGLIRQLFPQSYIIHCHRHPFDTCLSIYFRKFNDDHRYARNLSEIAKFYLDYSVLMKLWSDTPTEIFSLKYEELVRNQEKVSREIVDYTGLEWDDKCLSYYESDRVISTPSYTQANQPIYTGAINRWKNYRPYLQPLIDVLGEPEQYE